MVRLNMFVVDSRGAGAEPGYGRTTLYLASDIPV